MGLGLVAFMTAGQLIAAIAAAVAIGIIVSHIIRLTVSFISNKVKEKLKQRRIQKVAVGDLGIIINQCQNKASVDELEKLVNEGNATHFFAGVDENGNIVDIDFVGAETIDSDADALINRTGEGMIVIS